MATITQDKADLNAKHEIRNSKQSQMTKFQMIQTREFRNFEFVLPACRRQGFRYSNFGFLNSTPFLVPATPG
jgi:hypothetical protein